VWLFLLCQCSDFVSVAPIVNRGEITFSHGGSGNDAEEGWECRKAIGGRAWRERRNKQREVDKKAAWRHLLGKKVVSLHFEILSPWMNQ